MANACRAEAYSITRSLYHILAATPARSSSFPRQWSQTRVLQRSPVRTFASTTPIQKTGRGAKSDSAPIKRTQKFDEEIKTRKIKLVSESGGISEPKDLSTILASLDRKEERLLLLNQIDPETSICKIVTKKALYEAEKKKKEHSREQKKMGRAASSTKQLELNWAIDIGDLTHRLNKIREFLSEGRKVEIILAAKKRGRVATREECESLLTRLRDVTASVPGATIRKELEGPRGGFASMLLQGKVSEASDTPDE